MNTRKATLLIGDKEAEYEPQLVVWREYFVVTTNDRDHQQYMRDHVRLVDAPTPLDAWNEVMTNEHIQEQFVMYGYAKRLNEFVMEDGNQQYHYTYGNTGSEE